MGGRKTRPLVTPTLPPRAPAIEAFINGEERASEASLSLTSGVAERVAAAPATGRWYGPHGGTHAVRISRRGVARTRVTIYLSQPVYDRLRQVALDERRELSAIVEAALERALSRRQPKLRSIHEEEEA